MEVIKQIVSRLGRVLKPVVLVIVSCLSWATSSVRNFAIYIVIIYLVVNTWRFLISWLLFGYEKTAVFFFSLPSFLIFLCAIVCAIIGFTIRFYFPGLLHSYCMRFKWYSDSIKRSSDRRTNWAKVCERMQTTDYKDEFNKCLFYVDYTFFLPWVILPIYSVFYLPLYIYLPILAIIIAIVHWWNSKVQYLKGLLHHIDWPDELVPHGTLWQEFRWDVEDRLKLAWWEFWSVDSAQAGDLGGVVNRITRWWEVLIGRRPGRKAEAVAGFRRWKRVESTPPLQKTRLIAVGLVYGVGVGATLLKGHDMYCERFNTTQFYFRPRMRKHFGCEIETWNGQQAAREVSAMAPEQFRTYIDPETKVLDENALIAARDDYHSHRRTAENAGGALPLPRYRRDFPYGPYYNKSSVPVSDVSVQNSSIISGSSTTTKETELK